MPRGRGRGPQMSNEKAKDFKGTMKKLMAYLSAYKIGIFFVIVFAIGSTIFNIVGPKILGKATTEIFKGLVRKVSGGSGIDFDKIAHIVLTLLCLYLTSAVFSFVQGYIMTGVSQKLTYRLRKEISEKINRLPMNYFDKQTHGEVLSRITNDVDTLSQSLNQSATQVITSTTTIIGVLIMMLSISPLMTVVALLILPVSMGLISVIVKRSQKYFMSQQEYLGHVNGQVEEIYGGHNIIKAFNKEEDVIATFKRDNDILYTSASVKETYDVGHLAPEQTDFGVRISGDSMEPLYHTGDVAWIQKKDSLANGEIGIFYLNGNTYIKELHDEPDGVYLISLNQKYRPIQVLESDSFKIFGKVIGKCKGAEIPGFH